MTKEDILDSFMYQVSTRKENYEAILKAMDEYSKQQCILFGFHILGADPNDPEMGGVEEMTKTYDSFIEQQNKQQ